MATLHSVQSGNFTTATTWGLVDTTSAVLTYTSQVQPTAFQASPTFTPGVITVQGISIHFSNRSSIATGTFSVQLYNATTATPVAITDIAVIDLFNNNGSTTNNIGWVYFKFAAPVTTVATQLYSVRLNNTASNNVSVNFLTTTGNWTKVLVTATNQIPAATDVLIISGQHTAPGVNATYSVTMNSISNATAYGNLFISSKGTLIYGTASSTNYSLRLAGNLQVQFFGTLQIGSVTDPIPATSTATLEILCTTALQYTIVVWGTMTTYGTPKTIATKMVADNPTSNTSTITATATDWKNGDIFVMPSTTRTYTQYELLTLSTDAVGVTLTHNALVNSHGGSSTTKVQADLVNLTRNVIIRSATGTLLTNKTNIQMRDASITSFFYTAFLALGTGGTTTNSGICVTSLSTGSFNFQYNVVREIVVQAALNTANTALQTDNTATGITISNNIFYLLGWTTVVSTIVAAINDNNYFMGCLSSTQIILANFAGSGNVFTSNNTPAAINAFYANSSNNSFYSNNGIGLNMPTPSNLTTVNTNLSNFRFWRNNTYGLQIVTNSAIYNRNNIISFTGSYFFGNTTASSTFFRLYIKVLFSNSFFYGGTTLVQPNHFVGSSAPVDSVYYDRCYFGYSDSSLTSSPFTFTLSNPVGGSLNYNIFSNCYFNNPEMTTTTGYPYNNLYGGFRALNYNGVTGSNKEWTSNGTITTDTTIYLSGNKSTRLTPNNSIQLKLTSPIVRVPVKSGNTCAVSVNVRESISSDGANYNGSRPRLIYAFNPVLGNLSETIGDITKNLFQYPQNFDNAYWTKTTMTITPNSLSIAAPDGTFTADLFVEDNTTTRHRILTSGTTLSIGTYNLSIYAKKANHDWIQVIPVTDNFNVDNWANFNLSTGTIGNTGVGASASIIPVGDGWYRLSLQCDVIINGATFPTVCLSTNNTNSGRYPSYAGTLAQCFYIWGAQLTSGSELLPYYDNGQWETLSYTTPTFLSDGVAEFYIDCDGNTGWINVDDWNTTTQNDSRGQDYWGVSGVYIEPNYKKPGFSSTFTT